MHIVLSFEVCSGQSVQIFKQVFRSHHKDWIWQQETVVPVRSHESLSSGWLVGIPEGQLSQQAPGQWLQVTDQIRVCISHARSSGLICQYKVNVRSFPEFWCFTLLLWWRCRDVSPNAYISSIQRNDVNKEGKGLWGFPGLTLSSGWVPQKLYVSGVLDPLQAAREDARGVRLS